jgi:hypothetical protein
MRTVTLSDEDNYALHTYLNAVQEFQRKLDTLKMTSFGLQGDKAVYFADASPLLTSKWHLIGEFTKEFDAEAQTESYIFTWAHSRPEAQDKEYDQLQLATELTPLFNETFDCANKPIIKFNDYMMLNLIMSKVYNRTGYITQCYGSSENMSAIFALSDVEFLPQSDFVESKETTVVQSDSTESQETNVVQSDSAESQETNVEKQ